jgi:hypothetical protein
LLASPSSQDATGCDPALRPECCDGSSWLKKESHTHFAHDSQYEMHTDTFQPTFKLWLFEKARRCAGRVLIACCRMLRPQHHSRLTPGTTRVR